MKDFLLVRDVKSYISERCIFALALAGLAVVAVSRVVSLSFSLFHRRPCCDDNPFSPQEP